MRGYENLGKHTVLFHEWKEDGEKVETSVDRMIYRHYRTKQIICCHWKQYHRVFQTNTGYHVYIKR